MEVGNPVLLGEIIYPLERMLARKKCVMGTCEYARAFSDTTREAATGCSPFL
jgi:hypothetical protein